MKIEVDLNLIKEYGINPAVVLAILQKKNQEEKSTPLKLKNSLPSQM